MDLLVFLVSLLKKVIHDQMGYPNSKFYESAFDLDLLMYDPICPRRIRPHLLEATK